MSKFFNISTDSTLGGNSPSDVTVSSQKAIKTYVDSQTGAAPAFANIVGQPSDNANLATALNAKYDASNPNGYTSNVGTVTSVNNTSPDGNGNVTITIPNPLPSQIGQSGKFLTTDGTDPSWAAVDALPSQTGQSGKYLTTNGSAASWASVDALPSQTGQSGKFLTTDGTDASWGSPDLSGKADVDLSNLTADGKNIANWSNNVTNCITKIPQDIKLELNEGTLTLKAGSKVYVPNGDGVFDNYTSSVDKTVTNANNGQYLVFTTKAFEYLVLRLVSNCSSGSSATASTYSAWYDTTNNKVKYTSSGTTWMDSDGWTLPIALVTVSDGAISSIDQVFNGFGYIGSTVFALPDVKGLIPNGRNADGSLKNTYWTCNSVVVRSYSSTENNVCLGFNGSEFSKLGGTYSYNIYTNYNYNSNNLWMWTLIDGIFRLNSGVVSNLTPKTVFRALDFNDSSEVSGWGMPSDRYIDLTLGASGATYTAPANGWFILLKKSTAINQYISVNNPYKIRGYNSSPTSNSTVSAWTFARAGEGVTVTYTLGGTTDRFQFIYAEGDK